MLSVFLYVCDRWMLRTYLDRWIQAPENKCYRIMIFVSYREHKTNEYVWLQVSIRGGRPLPTWLSGGRRYRPSCCSVSFSPLLKLIFDGSCRNWPVFLSADWQFHCRVVRRPTSSPFNNIEPAWWQLQWYVTQFDRFSKHNVDPTVGPLLRTGYNPKKAPVLIMFVNNGATRKRFGWTCFRLARY